jgi:hypothetical protein
MIYLVKYIYKHTLLSGEGVNFDNECKYYAYERNESQCIA